MCIRDRYQAGRLRSHSGSGGGGAAAAPVRGKAAGGQHFLKRRGDRFWCNAAQKAGEGKNEGQGTADRGGGDVYKRQGTGSSSACAGNVRP